MLFSAQPFRNDARGRDKGTDGQLKLKSSFTTKKVRKRKRSRKLKRSK